MGPHRMYCSLDACQHVAYGDYRFAHATVRTEASGYV